MKTTTKAAKKPATTIPTPVLHEGLKPQFERVVDALHKGRLPGFVLLTGFVSDDLYADAQELSMAIVCSEKQMAGSCGICAECVRARTGLHDDVFLVAEPEATKTGRRAYKIDAAIAIQEHIQLRGFAGTARVVILREAADLSAQAVNRLLKTLEEPPSNTYVIMTTTRRRSLPDTLRGRASQWGFAVPGEALKAASLVGSDVSAGLERMLDPTLPPGIRLKIAEAVARQWKGGLGILTDSIDLVINRSLREAHGLHASHGCHGSDGSNDEGPEVNSGPLDSKIFPHVIAVREALGVLRQQAIGEKISLNVQLSLEAMVVDAMASPYGDY